MTEQALVRVIERRMGKQSLRSFAPTLGVTAAHLCDVLHGKRGIGKGLAASLGYELIVKTTRSFERIRPK